MGRFHTILGTGGIGTGSMWYLDDDRILSRNESRPGVLSDARDYCKQHIILHYLAKALADDSHVYAIGKIGQDAAGTRLLEEMREAGMDVSCVGIQKDSVTMQSVCLQYPDHCVCNVTTSNSACQHVDAEYIHQCIGRLAPRWDSNVLIVAAPEVPLAARTALLRIGKQHSAFCVASALCEEAEEFVLCGGLDICDLLVINLEEAEVMFKGSAADIDLFADSVQAQIPQTLTVIVTLGKDGSLVLDKSRKAKGAAAPIEKVVSTAGAGDAFTAGVLCGIHFGYDLFDSTGGRTALDFGHFFAGRSVMCKHTIDSSITANVVSQFVSG